MDGKIYDEHAKTVYYFLLSLCHNPHIAQDLTQETFLRAYQSMERFDGTCKLSVWLCQIAKHLWYQYLDKHKHEELKSLEDDALSIDTETQVFEGETFWIAKEENEWAAYVEIEDEGQYVIRGEAEDVETFLEAGYQKLIEQKKN